MSHPLSNIRFGILLLVLVLLGCESPDTTSPSVDFMTASDQPELFGEGIISTDLNERDLTIAPDGSELYFTVNNINNSVRAIIGMKRDGQEWTAPEVAPFSGRYKDIEPYFSPDGNRLYFASTRPVDGTDEKTDYDLWYVERAGDSWGQARHLPVSVNPGGDEFYPAVAANGNLYFTATDSLGNENIFLSVWEGNNYARPVALGSAVNTTTYEFNAYISPDERVLIFSSYGRDDGYGGGDLYVSHKDDNGDWQPALNLGDSINSPFLDYCPFVDWENGILYFSSNRKDDTAGDTTWNYGQIAGQSRSTLNGLGNLFKVRLPESISAYDG